MKKLILLLSIIALFFQSSFAQTGGLNFQGIARNATGAVLANQKINLKFSILKTTETGTVEYTETKEATTNAQGIFAVVVGEVNATSFAAVDWKVTPKFLKVEMDAAGGTSFITMGTTRLQNVPFAYYANGVNANNIDGAVPVSKGGTGAINAAGARSNIGAESIANKSTDLIADATSTTKYPSVKVIKDYVDTKVTSGSVSGTVAIEKGGTGASTATAALTNLGGESTANKSTDITADAASLTKYPSVKTIKDYVDTRVITGVSSSTDLNITSVNGLQLGRGAGTNSSNVAIGANALASNTTGFFNTASGASTLSSNTTGGYNTASGYQALLSNSIGFGNTASGAYALGSNTTGGGNTASGASALQSNTTGEQNTASGLEALSSNTTGRFNTASGAGALFSNTTGSYNTSSGVGALSSIATGSYNTAIGQFSGGSLETGANNTFIGALSNASVNNLSNSTALGNGAIVSASNTIQLGNTAITDVKTSGTLTASGYKTPSGTSSQYLMADGSVSAGIASTTFTTKVIVGSVTETSSSAVIEANSTTKGFLPPRMTFAQRNLISNPAPGLMIYCSDCGTYGEWQGYNGNRWTNISGAPASSASNNNFIFNDVVSITTGRVWMDRNLGASQVATSPYDENAFGDLYQWGRSSDGHQLRTSSYSNVLSNSDIHFNGDFLGTVQSQDWRSPQNDNLWQGTNGINNPCPTGYRLPTSTEWENERAGWLIDNFIGGFASSLKLPMAGSRSPTPPNGAPVYGYGGQYWSSTISTPSFRYHSSLRYAIVFVFNNNYSRVQESQRNQGYSIRCIKNQ